MFHHKACSRLFFQAKTPFTEVKDPLHDSSASPNDDLEIQGASSSAPITVIHDSKTPKKNMCT